MDFVIRRLTSSLSRSLFVFHDPSSACASLLLAANSSSWTRQS